MSWCDKPRPDVKDFHFCEGELIFQFTYSYILFCIAFFYINLSNDLFFLELLTSDTLLYKFLIAWKTIILHPDKFKTGWLNSFISILSSKHKFIYRASNPGHFV